MKAYIPQKKSRRRRKRSWSIALPSVRGILFLVVFFLLSGLGLHFYFQHQIKQLSQEKRLLLQTKSHLTYQITRLQKDPSAYEDIARQKFGLIKDGERLIIFGD